MPISTFKIVPSVRVIYEDAEWEVIELEGLEKVLARHVADGRREFLSVHDLRPTGAQENGEERESSRWRARITSRTVRPIGKPVEDLKYEEYEAVKKQTEEFQFLMRVVAEKDRSAAAALLREYARTYERSLAGAYRRLEIVRQTGSADGLRRSVRADKGNRRLSAAALQVMDSRLSEMRFCDTPRTVEDILEFVNGDLRQLGIKEISRTVLYQRMNEKSRKDQLRSQGKKEQVRNEYGPKAGHLPGADYPLSIVQVDHTPCQICFVDEKDRKPIGDAWLTLVIDCFSRMVLSFWLSFDAPSTLNTGMALARAFLPKQNFLRSIGVKGEWPCWGFPDIILVDNAAELNGRMMEGARRRYRFDIRNRPVGMPNFGGHVESAFKTFMYESKAIPGTKFSNPQERGEYDSEGNAVMTIAAFERLFADFIVNDYHLQEHSGEGMLRRAPIQRWTAGIRDGDVMPPTGLPEIPADQNELRISLMPVEMRVVKNATIELHSETYYSGALALLSEKVDVKKPLKKRQFEVRYDPRDISKIWILDPSSNQYIEAVFADPSKEPVSVWEHNARRKNLGKPDEVYKEDRYRSKLRREEIKKTETKLTKEARREAERARRNAAESLVSPGPVKKKPSKAAPPRLPLDSAKLAELRRKVREASIDDDTTT